MIFQAYSVYTHKDVAPLVQLSENHWVLELFHGPTLAFKDFALQLLGILVEHVLAKTGRRALVLGATSGDTGSAAISGCSRVPSVPIFILYPHERISEFQRRQMTTIRSENVHIGAVEGSFDDCSQFCSIALSVTSAKISSIISLSNLNDDASGSGFAGVACTVNNVSHQITYGNQIHIIGQNNNEITKTIECKIIDQIGNVGQSATIEVIQDGKSPDITANLNAGAVVGMNSSIQYSCTDTVTSLTQKITYSHVNGSSYSNGTMWLNGSQPILSQMSLFPVGYLTINYYCVDYLGNVGSSTVSGIYFTELAPYSEINYQGGAVHQDSNGIKYINSDTELELTYVHNGNGNGSMNITVFKQSSSIDNITTNYMYI